MKVQIELNFPDDRIFLNYWNWRNGDDVVCELKDGKIMLDDSGKEREISFLEFVQMVKDRNANPTR